MATFNFPSSPSNGDVYSFGGRTWTFNGTGWVAAASSASTEESTFTPVLKFGSASTGVTYASRSGKAAKIGNRVDFTVDLALSNKGAATGNLSIEGLPFPAGRTSIAVYIDASTGITGNVVGLVPSGTQQINLYQISAGVATPLTNAHATNSLELTLSGAYFITALGDGEDPVEGMDIGGNLSVPSTWQGAYPWVNLAYTMGPWRRVTGGGSGAFTQNCGTLTAAVSTDVFYAYLSDNGAGLPAGTYRVLNPSACKIGFGGLGNTNLTTALGEGGYTTSTDFTFVYPGGVGLGINCMGSMTKASGNLVILKPGTHAQWVAGNPWDPDFLSYLEGLSLRNIRLMDWGTNMSMMADWADRTPADAISFWNNNVVNFAPSFEMMCDLANRLDVDPWICVPVRASTTFVTNMATAIHGALESGRKWWCELHNEIWNFASVFGDSTNWVWFYDYTRRTATANVAGGVFNLPGHGIANGAVIHAFRTKENEAAFIQTETIAEHQGGRQFAVEVIDANNFKLHAEWTNPPTLSMALVPPQAGQVNLLFIVLGEAGKSAHMDVSYSDLCIRNWDLIEAVTGSDRIVRVLGSHAANWGITEARLAVGAMPTRTDAVAIAPYSASEAFYAQVAITSGQLTTSVWASASTTVHVAVYPAASTPSDADVIAGTVATGKNSVTAANAGSTYTATPAVAVTNGQQYKVICLFQEGTRWWRLQATVTASATPSTVNISDTFANQTLRDRLAHEIVIGWIESQQAVSGGIPIVNYESGIDSSTAHARTAEVAAWLEGWFSSPEYVTAMRYYNHKMAAAGVTLNSWFTIEGVAEAAAWTPWRISNSYTDVTDVRYLEMASYNGAVPIRTPIAVADATPDAITTAPSYPYTVHTFADETLTYTIISGNLAGNFAMVGAELRMINGNGINWASPNAQNVSVLASDGFTEDKALVSFSVGAAAWYETDALFAWDASTDANNTQIDPIYGAPLPIESGPGATISGGWWNMNGTKYSNDEGATVASNLSTKGFLLAIAMDNASDAGNYAQGLRVGALPMISMYTAGGSLRWYIHNGSSEMDNSILIARDTTRRVYWLFYEPSGNKLHFGHNQTSTNANGTAGETPGITFPTTLGRTVSTETCSFNYGGAQVVNRTGLTLTQALAIVQKMQTKFLP